PGRRAVGVAGEIPATCAFLALVETPRDATGECHSAPLRLPAGGGGRDRWHAVDALYVLYRNRRLCLLQWACDCAVSLGGVGPAAPLALCPSVWGCGGRGDDYPRSRGDHRRLHWVSGGGLRRRRGGGVRDVFAVLYRRGPGRPRLSQIWEAPGH